jgi:NCS1 family nucleobase:cation symporter-1
LFLGLLGICLVAWVAVFLTDSVLNRQNGKGYRVSLLVPETGRRVNWRAIVSWLVAVIVGFLFTNNALFTGPFARGIFRDNSLGVLLSGVVAAVCLWLINGKGEKDFDHGKNESQ